MNNRPEIHPSCYIDETAVIVGNVVIEKGCSIWPHAVIRGDLNQIIIREGSNVQDNCVIHVTKENNTLIGMNTSLGHGCIVESSHIGNNCIVGMNSCVLPGSRIEDNSMIGAGAVVKAGTHAASGSLLLGIPAKIIRITSDLREECEQTARNYHRARDEFLAGKYGRYRAKN